VGGKVHVSPEKKEEMGVKGYQRLQEGGAQFLTFFPFGKQTDTKHTSKTGGKDLK